MAGHPREFAKYMPGVIRLEEILVTSTGETVGE